MIQLCGSMCITVFTVLAMQARTLYGGDVKSAGEFSNLANLDSDRIQASPSTPKTTFLVRGDSNQTEFDFKKEYRQPEAGSSPQVDHFNEHYQDSYRALLLHEMARFPTIQYFSRHVAAKNRGEWAISRAFGDVRGEQSTEHTPDEELSGNVWLRKTPETNKDADLSVRHKNTRWNSWHSVVKRSNANGLSENSEGDRKTWDHRTQKMQITGLKVSNLEQKSSLHCPMLPVTTRTIVRCSNGRKVGSKCSLSCATGFVLAGKRKSRRCRRHRRRRRKYYGKSLPYWTGKQEDFQCVPVCKHLKVPEHGERTCQMVDLPRGRALRCTTKCGRGYRIVGSSRNTCMENGEWSGHPAVCNAAATRQTQKRRFKFREHQTLPCGEVHGLASFRKNGVIYLVAGDKAGNVVKVFRWGEGKFYNTPYQTFHYPSPEVVEVLSAPDGTIWLIVSGGGPVTMYRMLPTGRFQHSHTTLMFGKKRTAGDTIGFAELRGEFYRCYGRNRRETPVIVVHKLQDKRTDGDVFRRIMRKKLPGEKVHHCSMYTEGDSLYTMATLNKPDGQGRIMIGHLTRNRMKIVDVVSGKRLRWVSDSFGFVVDGSRYVAVSQATKEGKCLVYKKHLRPRPSVETG